ncbi:hypothetical protein KQI52_03930 [bacterium]|nr:hypothetical protein [bacterium]
MPINYQPSSFSSVNRDSMRGPNASGLPLNGTIVQRRDLNDGLTALTIALHGWELPPFEAGQYIDIALQTRSTLNQSVQLDSTRFVQNELIRRSYSIASSPKRRDQFELLLNLVPRGEFTPALWRLEEGARLHVNPRVRGRFTLTSALENHAHDIHVVDDPDVYRNTVPVADREAAAADHPEPATSSSHDWPTFHPHLIFIATGTGLAPYMSMLRDNEGSDPPWASATLLHSVRHAEDLAYRDELDALATLDGFRFRYIPTVTRPRPETGWTGHIGRLQPLLEANRYAELTNGRSIRPEDTHIYLCGNPEMIQSLRETFEAQGFVRHTSNTPGNLHFESYW